MRNFIALIPDDKDYLLSAFPKLPQKESNSLSDMP